MAVTRPPVTFDPLDPATHHDPYPAYRTLRTHRPLFHNPDRGFWAVSRHADVVWALRNVELLASGKEAPGPLDRFFGIREAAYVAAESARHDALRRALHPLLGPAALEGFARSVQEVVAGLLERLDPAATVDLAGALARPLPALVICRLLGLPDSDWRRLQRWVDDGFGRTPLRAEVPDVATAAYFDLRGYLVERLARPTAGLARLADAARSGLLTSDEVVDTAALIVGAGIKTSSTLIGTLVLRLAELPDQQALVWERPDLADRAVEETLRHDAPAQWIARVATHSVETPHGVIPAGDRVLLLLGAANRDELRYHDAASFDVLRTQQRHLAFGGGLHACSGAGLARLEARAVLHGLAERFADLRLAGQVSRIYTPAERELAHLPCTFSAR